MKHFFVQQPSAALLVAGRPLEIQETADVDELDVPGRLYLGSTDDDGNLTTALVGVGAQDPAEIDLAQIEGMLGSIRGPFFKATIIGMTTRAHSPAVINADHVALARPAKDGPNDTAAETIILFDNGLEYRLAEPYETVFDELYGVRDVDTA